MEGVFEEKVPGGKLLRVKVIYDASKIKSVRITGDFFLYPEEKIEYIEKKLSDISIEQDENSIANLIDNIVKNEKIELIGITTQSIAKAIKGAIK